MTATAIELLPLPRFAAEPGHPLAEQVLPGLRSQQKTLPRSLQFDVAGVALMERISEQPEWYLDRAQLEIITTHRSAIIAAAGPGTTLIEDPTDPTGATRELREALPWHSTGNGARRITFVPEAVFGALHPTGAAALLVRARRAVGRQGAILLGVDRLKPAEEFEAAWNDRAGLQTALAHHLLLRINRELDADFDEQLFHHLAFFDEESRRMETHLVSIEPQVVHVAEEPIFFDEGESIWTGSSYAYDLERLTMVTRLAGLDISHLWTDQHDRCWVAMLTPTQRD